MVRRFIPTLLIALPRAKTMVGDAQMACYYDPYAALLKQKDRLALYFYKYAENMGLRF